MFEDWIGKWKAALTAPEDTFAKEMKNANLKDALVWSAAAGTVGGFVSGLLSALISLVFSPSVVSVLGLLFSPIMYAIGFAILMPIGLIISVGIMFLIAKLLGGEGSFTAQAYLTSMFASPLVLVSVVCSAIPLGFLISGALSLYQLYLEVLVLKAVHKFSTKRAVVAVLVPVIIAVILVFLMMATIFAIIAAAGIAGATSGR